MKKKMIDHLFIDADSIIYRAGFSGEYHQATLSKDGEVVQTKSVKERKKLVADGFTTLEEEDILLPVGMVIAAARNQLNRIIEHNPARTVFVFLDPHTRSWRRRFDPNYKANRILPKPEYYGLIYDWIETNYLVLKKKYHEADDMVSIYARAAIKEDHTYTIAGIDKDLRQIPGMHYDYLKGEHIEIDPWKAEFNFYTQLLTGDVSDNVPGLNGIGPVKAHKALQECDTEVDMWNVVHDLYNKIDPSLDDRAIILRATMLKLLTKIGDFRLWQPPI